MDIQAGGCRLQVFRVGKSPLLSGSSSPPRNPVISKRAHTHFTYEVFFVTSGFLELVTEEQTKAYQNAILIIPPRIKHFSVPSQGESYCLLFSFLDKVPGSQDIQTQLDRGILELPMAEDTAFYVKRFAEKTEENTPNGEEDARHLAALIFSWVLRVIRQGQAVSMPTVRGPERHISAIEQYLNRNIRKKVTLSDVAQSVHLSTRQTARIIEKEYGCSFSALIMDKRLASASILLKNTQLPIAQVAAQTFFGTPTYFYTVFRRKYGMTPLTYRKEHTQRQEEV